MTALKEVMEHLDGFPPSRLREVIHYIDFLKSCDDLEEETLSPHLETELENCLKEAEEDLRSGKSQTIEEHLEWVNNL